MSVKRSLTVSERFAKPTKKAGKVDLIMTTMTTKPPKSLNS